MDWQNNTKYMDAWNNEVDFLGHKRCCSICNREWGYYSDTSKTHEEINIEERESGFLCPPCIDFKKLSGRILELEKQINKIMNILK